MLNLIKRLNLLRIFDASDEGTIVVKCSKYMICIFYDGQCLSIWIINNDTRKITNQQIVVLNQDVKIYYLWSPVFLLLYIFKVVFNLFHIFIEKIAKKIQI